MEFKNDKHIFRINGNPRYTYLPAGLAIGCLQIDLPTIGSGARAGTAIGVGSEFRLK